MGHWPDSNLLAGRYEEETMRFSVDIACDNSAFGECPTLELRDILRRLADTVELGSFGQTVWVGPIRDTNGNTVGSFQLGEF